MTPGAIHHLNCGTMCPRGARLLSGRGGLLGPSRLICHCLLIEGSDGLTLVDTGFGIDDVRTPRQLGRAFTTLTRPTLQESETAIEQIQQLGFQPEDVKHIAVTHLDLDHAGGLPDFPAAEIHLLGKELQAAMSPNIRERGRYISAHWAHNPKWVEHQAGGDGWFGFESVRIVPESDPEILLIPLLGHTRGHTGVAVKQNDRWLLHCGDAYFHHGQVETPSHCPPGLKAFQALNQANGALRRENTERLRELAERNSAEVDLICSHDPVYLPSAK